MHRHWIEACQREGRRVGVVSGAIAAEVNPTEVAPMVRPATVSAPATQDGTWWLDVEIGVGDYILSQMYQEDEILGLWPA